MKKIIKNHLSLVTRHVFLLSAFCFLLFNVFAQGGTIGPLTWKFENRTLTISGKGEMPDFWFFNSSPWWDYSGSIDIVTIENGVTSIGEYAFSNCWIQYFISIPNSITKIGRRAFADSGLPSITLPVNITNIGEGAFAFCEALTSVTNLNPIPISIPPNVFYNVNTNACTLYVPIGSVDAYKRAEVWKEFNIVGIEVGIKDINESDPAIVIYPNPTTGMCTITIPDEFLYESNLTLSIYDNTGKLLQQIEINNGAEDFSLKLDHRAKGIYMVVLSNGKKSYKGRVMFN